MTSNEAKAKIAAMSHEQLCRRWRFAEDGDELLMGEIGDYFYNRLFKHFGGFTPEISKRLGLKKTMTKQYEETKEIITLHGLGFLQIKLGGEQRLHIWHPDLPRRACFKDSMIHNHRFSFKSTLLIGEMANVMHYVELCHEDHPTHVAYLHEGERTKFGNRPWIEDLAVKVYPSTRKDMKAGDGYVMAAYDYHLTLPLGDGKVATVMKKQGSGIDGAHSLCTAGVEPDVDFDRKQWPDNRLWEIVLDVLSGTRHMILYDLIQRQ